MSNSIYPGELPGLAWPVTKTPIFSTNIQVAKSLREVRESSTRYPIVEFKLKYEVLHQDINDTLRTLYGFFCSRRGRFDSFRFDDVKDNSIINQSLGQGDGVTTQFQLIRTYGGFAMPITEIKPNPVPEIRIDGLIQSSGYAISSVGVVTFSSPPDAGALLSASFDYWFRVRFKEDFLDFEEFAWDFFSAEEVVLRSIKP